MVTTNRIRLTVDVTPELRRRIRLAAARQDSSIRDYIVGILEGAVPVAEGPDTARGLRLTPELKTRLDRLRERVMRGRKFKDDSTDLLAEARAERHASQ
jgi:hypothetical protein